ncbi:MAG: hypothetical protein E6J41_06990 [Chloroflexi bacterium]|nr:MAG: hypothetical protein E6J41_06990 [Chloroflexota bacterium]
MRRAGAGLRRRAVEGHGLVPDGPVRNRRRPLAGLLVMAGVNDEAAWSACVESSAGRSARAAERRSALSIWNCDLERQAGARADVKLTRRSLAVVELVPVVALELGGEAARVRSVASGRLPARAGAVVARSLAAILAGVAGGTEAVTRCPQMRRGGRWAVAA